MNSHLAPRWYLDLMGPHSNGEWLTFNELYTQAAAFNSLLDDLVEPFSADEVDLVAGPEAMGLHLGGGVAARLRKGFLPIRKAGKLRAPVDAVEYGHRNTGVASIEMQIGSVKPGARVLLVDQWIETGESMYAAIELVKRQQGKIAGIATICIEEGKGGEKLRDEYKCSSAVLPNTLLQRQCNAHSFTIPDTDRR